MSSAAGVPGTRAGSNCRMKRAAVYQRRRPERSAAYLVVRQNLETWLAQRVAGRLAAGADWVVDPVPGYVERDLRKLLICGILAHGFARACCEKCGRDFLVAYSCKGRIPAGAFFQKPEVDSAIVRVDLHAVPVAVEEVETSEPTHPILALLAPPLHFRHRLATQYPAPLKQPQHPLPH